MIQEQRGGARAFVRSLNILLKFARLYEFGHAKTIQQFETAWKELRNALEDSGGSGVLLGASGTQILLDGVPLGSAAATWRKIPQWRGSKLPRNSRRKCSARRATSLEISSKIRTRCCK